MIDPTPQQCMDAIAGTRDRAVAHALNLAAAAEARLAAVLAAQEADGAALRRLAARLGQADVRPELREACAACHPALADLIDQAASDAPA